MADQDKKVLFQKLFDQVAEGYDRDALRFFRLSAMRIPDRLGLRGNEHMLDVACGTGNASVELARALPEGRVTGVDLSAGMLEVARKKAGSLGLDNITFSQMDMEELDLQDRSFDGAVCSFGIFFVEDMPGQLRRIAGKVKEGGRVLTTSFSGIPFGDLSHRFFDSLKSFGVQVDVDTLMPLSSISECSKLFETAGLKDVRTEVIQNGYHLQAGSMWWDIVMNAGFRRFVAAVPEERRQEFQDEHMMDIKALGGDDGIWLDVKVIYTTGSTSA